MVDDGYVIKYKRLGSKGTALLATCPKCDGKGCEFCENYGVVQMEVHRKESRKR